MQVKMKTLSCGPEGSRLPGKVYEVPDAEGEQLIKGQYADRVGPAPVTPATKPIERAVSTVRPERRAVRRGTRPPASQPASQPATSAANQPAA